MRTFRANLSRLSWCLGAAVIVAIGAYSGAAELLAALSRVHIYEILIWVLSTIAMRAVLISSLTLPLRALGHSVPKLEVFCLGWARSFCNQILPLSGLAYYSVFLHRRGLSLGEVAALSSPQFILAAFSVGVAGFVTAIWCHMGPHESPLALVAPFGVIMLASHISFFYSDAWLIRLPDTIRERIRTAYDALQRFRNFGLVRSLILIHLTAILLRAIRLFVLFAAISPDWTFSSVLLLSCLGEIVLLLQLTPGGIGIREGAIVAGAIMMNLDAGTAAAVAVIDRALMVGIVCLAAPWAFWQLNGWTPGSNEGRA